MITDFEQRQTEQIAKEAADTSFSADFFRFFTSKDGAPILKWSKYIPPDIKPHPKQVLALAMDQARDLLYGGAAGGGKSEYLLCAALQYADMPGYSGLILRKHLKDLEASDALLNRAQKWLAPLMGEGIVDEQSGLRYACRYIPHLHTFEFLTYYPDGSPGPVSRLQFGYIGEGSAEDAHQGAAFTFIGIDEAGQHTLKDATWLFSRNRFTKEQMCQKHGDDPERMEDSCKYCQAYKLTPLRFRLTANPGGIGHEWIKKRYDIRPAVDLRDGRKRDPNEVIQYRGFNPKKPFIPSYYYDNPNTGRGYGESLDELTETDKAQLKNGDWNASPDSRFKRDWIKYYEVYRDTLQWTSYDAKGNPLRKHSWSLHDMYIFSTVDPATTVREGPGDEQIIRHGAPSKTVISTWGMTKDERFLFWLDCVIFSIEIPDVIKEIQASYLKWRHNKIICEVNGPGIGVFQPARQMGLPMHPNFKVRDKLVNATQAIIRMEQGRVFFPRWASWLEQGEGEIFTWFGHPHQPDDVIDTLSDAARHVAEQTGIWYEPEESMVSEDVEIPETSAPMSVDIDDWLAASAEDYTSAGSLILPG